MSILKQDLSYKFFPCKSVAKKENSVNKMKAARLFGPNDIRVVEVPIPDLKPREVLCKVVKSGICGTD